MISIKKLSSITLITMFIFLFIYNPPMFPFNTMHICFIVSILYILYDDINKYISFISRKKIFLILVLGLLSILFGTIIVLVNETSFGPVYQTGLIFIEVLLISYAIWRMIRRTELSKDNFFDILIAVGLIQAGIAIILFLSPTFKAEFVKFFFGTNHSDELLYWMRVRYYGLANNMLYAMPIATGFISAISFSKFMNNNKVKYFVFSLILLVPVILNARIGLIVFVIASLFLVKPKKEQLKEQLKLISIFVLTVILAIVYITFFLDKSSEFYIWFKDLFKELLSFVGIGEGSYLSEFIKMTVIPPPDIFLFGMGKTIMIKEPLYGYSDIGFINDLFFGGIFYTVLLYTAVILIFLLPKNKDKSNRMIYAIIFVMIISNVKGIAFTSNNFMHLFVLISVYSFMNQRGDYYGKTIECNNTSLQCWKIH